MIELHVIGIPAPQGSKTAMLIGGKPRVIEGSSTTGRAKHKSWREGVTMAARDWLAEHPQPPLTEPIRMAIDFIFPLPAGDPYRTRHTVKPDAGKCARTTEDALVVAGLLKDDSLIFDTRITKRYAHGKQATGAVICIWPCGEEESADRDRMKCDAKEIRRAAKAAS